jgi:hypothetical protein
MDMINSYECVCITGFRLGLLTPPPPPSNSCFVLGLSFATLFQLTSDQIQINDFC